MKEFIGRTIDLLAKVPSIIWIILAAGFAIITFSILVTGLFVKFANVMTEYEKISAARESEYEQRIEEVKRDCTLKQQVISPTSTVYRYRCAGGVDFEFEEDL